MTIDLSASIVEEVELDEVDVDVGPKKNDIDAGFRLKVPE